MPYKSIIPCKPSVSKQITLRIGSNAAQTPKVQQLCSFDVLNTSLPLKNIWFMVWLFPSPVFPNIETTFTLISFPTQFNFRRNSSALETFRFSCASSNKKLLLLLHLLLWHFVQMSSTVQFSCDNKYSKVESTLSRNIEFKLSIIAGAVDSTLHGFQDVLIMRTQAY